MVRSQALVRSTAEGERFGADMGMRLLRPELRRVRFIETPDVDE